MIEFSQTKVELTKALLAVQRAVGNVKRDATNPHFKSRYATLENVVAALRGPCVDNGIVITQAAGDITDGKVSIETRVMHESGEWMASILPLPVSKMDAQGVGSAITYGCRYSLMSLFCLPPADDDGNAAVEKGNGAPTHTTGGITQMHPRTKVNPNGVKSSSQMKKDGVWESVVAKIDGAVSPEGIAMLKEQLADEMFEEAWPANWQNRVNEMLDEREAEIIKPVNIIGAG